MTKQEWQAQFEASRKRRDALQDSPRIHRILYVPGELTDENMQQARQWHIESYCGVMFGADDDRTEDLCAWSDEMREREQTHRYVDGSANTYFNRIRERRF